MKLISQEVCPCISKTCCVIPARSTCTCRPPPHHDPHRHGETHRLCRIDSEAIAELVAVSAWNQSAAFLLVASSTANNQTSGESLLSGFNDSYAKNIFPIRMLLHTNAGTRTAATRGCSYGGRWLRRHH